MADRRDEDGRPGAPVSAGNMGANEPASASAPGEDASPCATHDNASTQSAPSHCKESSNDQRYENRADKRSGHNAPIDDGENAQTPRAAAPRFPTRNSNTRNSNGNSNGNARPTEVYGALDLGTNNCRLLVARPSRRGFRVVDAFSRIIRLGEGVSRSGELSQEAMARTIEALKVCSSKMRRNQVGRARLVATQACRIASNADEFLKNVQDQTGLAIEILTEEDEARLAVSGCASLIDVGVEYVLVFDIGGGSSELIWLDLTKRQSRGRTAFVDRLEAQDCMVAWTSLPVGVVTLAEHFGGNTVAPHQFDDMVEYVSGLLAPFEREHRFNDRIGARPAHLLGTSGTITTVAGVKLGLKRYDRAKVDGCWLDIDDARAVTDRLLSQTHEERLAEPCVGRERADLVLAGCAIVEALIQTWPCQRMRVADRGLREGILATLMSEDGVYRVGRRRGGRRHNRSRRN